MSDAARRVAASLTLVLATLWPGVVLGANTIVSAQVCQSTFGPVTLGSTTTSPTTGTSADVNGTADPNANVVIKVDGVQQAQVMAASDGTYAATVPLVIGDNTIIAEADDGTCGHTDVSPSIMIHRDQVPPDAPQISTPISGAVTTATSVLVQGTAEVASDVEVLLGGVVVATMTVGGDGAFGATVPLAMGSNTIQARATNPAGTGPLTAPVYVTRQPAPVPPSPTPSPSPSPRPSPAPVLTSGPQITSPSSGTITTSSSIIVSIQGARGATATISVNGEVTATVRLASDGTGQVTVPLSIGQNLITASVNGRISATVAVLRNPPAAARPVITSPEDGSSTKTPAVTVEGVADPGRRIEIYVGTTKAATVVADEVGKFAAQVSLRSGLNLIYAQLEDSGDTVIRSSTIQVNYDAPTTTGQAAAQDLRSILKAIVTVPLSAIILTGQAWGDVLGALTSSPARVAAVMLVSVAGSTATRGLLGFELFLLLPGLLRLARARRLEGASVVRGRVIDTVTGRPIMLAQITAGVRNSVHGVTGRDGMFEIPVLPGTDTTVHVTRPGYGSISSTHMPAPGERFELNLEPNASSHNPLDTLRDIFVGTLTWSAIGLGAAVGVYLVATQPGLGSAVVAVFAVAVLGVNLVSLATQPHYRWGRVTDLGGVPFGDVEVRLLDVAKDKTISTYRSDQSGRYTLYAHPGDYRLNVVAPDGNVLHEEGITIKRRATYIGFGLKLPRT